MTAFSSDSSSPTSSADPTSNDSSSPGHSSRFLALSPSRLADYRRCPLQYRLKAIDKIPEPKTLAQVKGTHVHLILERFHQLPEEQKTFDTAVSLIKPLWEEICANDSEAEKLAEEMGIREYLNECWTLIRGYFSMENPQGSIGQELEKFIETTLPNGVPIRGFIDRVDVAPTGAIRLVDYKTGKKPKPQYSHDAYSQMTFYALAWWRIFNTIPAQLKLMYIKYGAELSFQPTVEKLEEYEHSLGEAWDHILRDIAEESFRPHKNPLCGWCSFHSFCPIQGGSTPPFEPPTLMSS